MKLQYAALATACSLLLAVGGPANAQHPRQDMHQDRWQDTGQGRHQGTAHRGRYGVALSTILKSVERQNRGKVVEAELDDGFWEIKTCARMHCSKLHVDPASGKVVRSKRAGPETLPPAKAVALSSVVQRLEARNAGRITDVELKNGRVPYWEVKVENGPRKTKLLVDALTGRERR